MFGNSFVDYCALNFSALVELANSEFLLLDFLNDDAKSFVIFYRLLNSRKGELIKISDFIAIGIDFQKLCLLSFLISFNQGNKVIEVNQNGVTYTP